MAGDMGDRCSIGTFCPEGSTEETPCTPGYYCGARGLDEVSGPCTEGYYCELYATSPTPISSAEGGNICPQGHYCPEASFFPTACPPGYYNN